MNMNYKILIAFMVLVGSSHASAASTTLENLMTPFEKVDDMLLALKYPHISDDETLKHLKNPKKDTLNFYRLNLTSEEHATILAIKTNKELEALKENKDGKGLYEKINKQVLEKAETLREKLQKEKWIKYIYDKIEKKDVQDNDKILHAHFENFIAKSVEFDAKRQTFSKLHKVIEGLRASFEVERKFKDRLHAIEKALSSLKAPDATKNKNIEFRLVESESVSILEKYFYDFKLESKPNDNILQAGLDASNASTSQPETLGYFFAASTAIAVILLGMKYKSISSKYMEEKEDEE